MVAETAREGAVRAEAEAVAAGEWKAQEEEARARAGSEEKGWEGEGSDLEDREAGLAMAAEDWAPRRAEAAGGRGSSAQTHRRE